MPTVEQLKQQGNKCFQSGDFDGAVRYYSQALELDPASHVLYSNRSAAYAGLEKWEEAAADGLSCIKHDSAFFKGYYRACQALKNLRRYAEALKVADDGLKRFADNADLQALKREVVPLAEAEEKARRRGMSKAELLKELANDLFKGSRFEDAIPKYSEALHACEDPHGALALTILNNRAACHKQLGNNQAVVDDTTVVLEIEPHNFKARLRRALALEALEKFRLALEDIREVLTQDPENRIANDAQHRIGQAVRVLKTESRAI